MPVARRLRIVDIRQVTLEAMLIVAIERQCQGHGLVVPAPGLRSQRFDIAQRVEYMSWQADISLPWIGAYCRAAERSWSVLGIGSVSVWRGQAGGCGGRRSDGFRNRG